MSTVLVSVVANVSSQLDCLPKRDLYRPTEMMPPQASSSQFSRGTRPASKVTHTNARKTARKKPISVPERLKRLFTSLCAQIDGGHFTNAAKTCDKSVYHDIPVCFTILIAVSVLRIEPNDKDALQTKLFLLLQTEQYDAALAIVGTAENDNRHAFERSYSLYRLHREQEAIDGLKVIKEESSEDERGPLHLEAQLVCPLSSKQSCHSCNLTNKC